MRSGSVLSHDVGDAPASDGERISDQRTVTAPGQRFGAHDHSFLIVSTLLKLGQAGEKGRRRHIVGVPTKGGVAPADVRRIFRRMAQATKSFQVEIVYASILECIGKLINAKLGMRERPGNCAHVYQELDRVHPQQLYKFLNGKS